MADLIIERRVDGTLALTHRAVTGRRLVALAAFGIGAVILAISGQLSTLENAVVVPLGVIVVLAGLAALRHRDWIVFDPTARQIAFRRGLGSMFRPVRAFSYDDVRAIQLQPAAEGAGAVAVELICAGEVPWPIDASADRGYVARLAAALHDVGGWPVHEEDERGRAARGENHV